MTYRGSKRATFTALDKLPAELRREIAFACRVYDAEQMLGLYNQWNGYGPALEWLTGSIHSSDERDVQQLGAAYRQRYGAPLPHIGAEATIMRFSPVTRRPRVVIGRGCGAASRAALASSARLLPKFVA